MRNGNIAPPGWVNVGGGTGASGGPSVNTQRRDPFGTAPFAAQGAKDF